MLLVYLTSERLVSIKYPMKVALFRGNKTQLIYFSIILFYNLAFYLPFSFFFGFESYQSVSDQTNSSKNLTKSLFCAFKYAITQQIFCYLDLTNRIVIPFLLIIVFKIILIDYIFKSRKRVYKNLHLERKQKFSKRHKVFDFSSFFKSNLFDIYFTKYN